MPNCRWNRYLGYRLAFLLYSLLYPFTFLLSENEVLAGLEARYGMEFEVQDVQLDKNVETLL